jgi:branched-chain amino acid transport system ATP-binding protein
MTVGENLRVGAFVRRRARDDVADGVRVACALFPTLTGRMHQPSGELSGGEQQMVAIAQALLGKPNVLMLDEPSFGLAPAVVDAIYRVLRQLASDGIGILLVEQEVERALQSCDRVHVMEGGRIVRSGAAAELGADEVARIMVGGAWDA